MFSMAAQSMTLSSCLRAYPVKLLDQARLILLTILHEYYEVADTKTEGDDQADVLGTYLTG
jgi:hypothetical protein